MVERQHRSTVNLFALGGIPANAVVQLDAESAHHARVRRMAVGDTVRLMDGCGSVGDGRIAALTKSTLSVEVGQVTFVPAPTPLEVLVPVADRDRMLVAAEKCVELQITAWRPVLWARSRSVAPRGEGDKFREKVVARMIAALEQSGGAWLPTIEREAVPDDAFAAIADDRTRVILDASGVPLALGRSASGVALAVGPEGGFEAEELAHATSLGWSVTALASSTLRFETAVIAGTAVIRALQHHARSD